MNGKQWNICEKNEYFKVKSLRNFNNCVNFQTKLYKLIYEV